MGDHCVLNVRKCRVVFGVQRPFLHPRQEIQYEA
jgi:hypothetical protein